MQHLGSIFVAVAVLIASVQAHAQTSHMRLLTHAHKQIGESGLGMAGWVIAPSVTDAPDQWLAIAGPSYNGAGWNTELMGGTVVKQGEAKALLDARLELTPDLFGIPLYVWANSEWIATGGQGTFYSYLQTDYVLPSGIALVGVETENVINADVSDLSAGPHLVIPMGQVALVGAYQFHTAGDRQFWARLVLIL